MQFRRSCLTAVALVAVSAAPALAANPAGWYVSGQAGANWQEDSSNTGAMTFHSETDPGFSLLGSVGRYLGNGFRVEGEVGYRQADLSKMSIRNDGGVGGLDGVTTNNVSGNSNIVSFMGNGFYDFTLPNTKLTPYIGGGIGFADVTADGWHANNVRLIDDSDVVFAYQAGAGVSYPLTPVTDAFLDYRYFATQNPTFQASNGGQVTSQIATNTISVGLRYKF